MWFPLARPVWHKSRVCGRQARECKSPLVDTLCYHRYCDATLADYSLLEQEGQSRLDLIYLPRLNPLLAFILSSIVAILFNMGHYNTLKMDDSTSNEHLTH